jgi:hypothetical protein
MTHLHHVVTDTSDSVSGVILNTEIALPTTVTERPRNPSKTGEFSYCRRLSYRDRAATHCERTALHAATHCERTALHAATHCDRRLRP